jgi:thiamine-phosphate pyrophosphorylase
MPTLYLPKSVLCYVTDRRSLAPQPTAGQATFASLLETISAAATAGVDWIQIREKDLEARELAELSALAVRACRGTTARVIVNDRLDVAFAAPAGGAHLGESSLPVAEARRLIEARRKTREGEFLVGVSCHSTVSARTAAEGGADYIFFGPIFPTPAKAAFGAPQGLARLAEVCRAVHVPVLAIGGITAENAAACWECGAAGIAAIRLFQESAQLATSIAQLRALR